MKRTSTGVKTTIFYTTLKSPVGTIYITFTKNGVSRIDLNIGSEKNFIKDFGDSLKNVVKKNHRGIPQLKKALRAYFSPDGKQPSFKYPIDLLEGTPFERKVWHMIKKIPYGKVVSYKDIAMKIGKPKAVRAVGSACGKNPLPIIIPCHRVIAKDKGLGGYSPGIKIKRKLLEIEGVNI
ncbi:MAG: methylated-DNA--[protein]-cysteine S-methyltransferase [Nitrospirota bacterium]